MQISVLKKLLQLIKNEIPTEEKSLEETLEQSPEKSEEAKESRNGGDEGVQSAECRVQSAECGVQSAECRVQSSECGAQSCESEGVQSDEDEKPAPAENNRSHLTSSVPRAAKAPTDALTKGELAEIRQLFNNLDDNEIQRLYKKVTKN